ncbi:hypothetical protein C5C74_14235 [Rathayibacter sp. AY1E8]|nr:hypothetical protein C5C74_14235 [Rathayibacter sp. AY1E8]
MHEGLGSVHPAFSLIQEEAMRGRGPVGSAVRLRAGASFADRWRIEPPGESRDLPVRAGAAQ